MANDQGSLNGEYNQKYLNAKAQADRVRFRKHVIKKEKYGFTIKIERVHLANTILLQRNASFHSRYRSLAPIAGIA
jgi:hypothetical protein